MDVEVNHERVGRLVIEVSTFEFPMHTSIVSLYYVMKGILSH